MTGLEKYPQPDSRSGEYLEIAETLKDAPFRYPDGSHVIINSFPPSHHAIYALLVIAALLIIISCCGLLDGLLLLLVLGFGLLCQGLLEDLEDLLVGDFLVGLELGEIGGGWSCDSLETVLCDG